MFQTTIRPNPKPRSAKFWARLESEGPRVSYENFMKFSRGFEGTARAETLRVLFTFSFAPGFKGKGKFLQISQRHPPVLCLN
jgi:hypothetical protein